MIKILSEDIINKIAAGEVIERPASVIKELIENAIDAHSTRMRIDIEDAGKKKLCVSDNGIGMTVDELQLAAARHATSKLFSFDDLFSLKTLGFRGEALPSIAAVSRLTINTQSRESNQSACTITIEGGKILSQSPGTRSPGTTVEVSDLFFNTPVRKKFLKKDATEHTAIIRVIEELALAHPAITFEVYSNGKESFIHERTNTVFDRARQILGGTRYETLVSSTAEYPWIRITALVSKISYGSFSRKDQYIFINNRPVVSRTAIKALYDSYQGNLPSGKHPVCVLWLDINPQLVDINVHPTKREVRITKEQDLYQVINDTIKKSMVSASIASPVFSIPYPASDSPRAPEVREAVESFFQNNARLVQKSFQARDTKHPIQQPLTENVSFADSSTHVIGQLHQLYILVEAEHELWIIDQHAAEERVLFEAFSASTLDHIHTQKLLIPYHWEMTREEFALMQTLVPELSNLGISVEEFGTQSMIVREIPLVLGEIAEVHRFLELLIEALNQEQETFKHTLLSRKEVIIRSACRASVKSRDYLSGKQLDELVHKLKQCKQPFICPHGRPTLVRLPRHEIDRKFGR